MPTTFFNRLKNTSIYTIFSCLILLLTLQVSTVQAKAEQDLEANMKQMRFEFKQAMKTNSADTLTSHIIAFKKQLAIAKEFPFSKERIEKAHEGLNKVEKVIEKITLPVEQADIEQVKKQLSTIDDIKEQYHDKKVSLWQRFYEMFFGKDEDSPELILLDESS